MNRTAYTNASRCSMSGTARGADRLRLPFVPLSGSND